MWATLPNHRGFWTLYQPFHHHMTSLHIQQRTCVEGLVWCCELGSQGTNHIRVNTQLRFANHCFYVAVQWQSRDSICKRAPSECKLLFLAYQSLSVKALDVKLCVLGRSSLQILTFWWSHGWHRAFPIITPLFPLPPSIPTCKEMTPTQFKQQRRTCVRLLWYNSIHNVQMWRK